MPSMLNSANSMIYAQFHARGGWRNTLAVSGVYALVICGAIGLSVANSNRTTTVMESWATGLLVLQGFLLMLFGTSRVSAAVRADITAKLLESHRLMPMSPVGAVLGYVVGAPCQALMLWAVNLMIGLVVGVFGGVSVDHCLLANLILLAMSVVLWIVVANIAFSNRGGMALLVLGVIFASRMVGNDASGFLPGLWVLLHPIFSREIMGMNSSLFSPSPLLVIALAAYAGIGLVVLLAAARKYRVADAIGFDPPLATALLLAWMLISLIGMAMAKDFQVRPWRNPEPALMCSSTIISGFVLALLTLSSAAKTDVLIRQARIAGDRAGIWSNRRAINLPIVVALTVFLLLLPAFMIQRGLRILSLSWDMNSDNMGLRPNWLFMLAVSLTAFTVGLALLLRWTYRSGRRTVIYAAIWLIATTVLPLILGVPFNPDRGLTEVSMASPMATVVQCFERPRVRDPDMLPGLIVQVLLVVIPLTLCALASRRKESLDQSAISPGKALDVLELPV